MPDWLPKLESITVHPAERASLEQQLPTALVYGEMIEAGVTIVESAAVTSGTILLHFDEGADVTCALGYPPPEPQRWIKCGPVTGLPFGSIVP